MIASFLICTNTFDDIARKALKSCIEQNTSYKFEIILVVNGPQHVEMSEIISEFFGNEITIFNSDKEGLVENLDPRMLLREGFLPCGRGGLSWRADAKDGRPRARHEHVLEVEGPSFAVGHAAPELREQRQLCRSGPLALWLAV